MSEEKPEEVEVDESNDTLFKKLASIDVSKHKKKKSNLNYIPWAYAWSELKYQCDDSHYQVLENTDGMPYFNDPLIGIIVKTLVTVEGLSHPMWLPVMDGANKAMKDQPYTYEVKKYVNGKWNGEFTEKRVEQANMFDVNKTIMRCLVKNFAMFGVAIDIFIGEDMTYIDSKILDADEEAESKRQQKEEEFHLIRKRQAETLDYLLSKDHDEVISEASTRGYDLSELDDKAEVIRLLCLSIGEVERMKVLCKGVAARMKNNKKKEAPKD